MFFGFSCEKKVQTSENIIISSFLSIDLFKVCAGEIIFMPPPCNGAGIKSLLYLSSFLIESLPIKYISNVFLAQKGIFIEIW